MVRKTFRTLSSAAGKVATSMWSATLWLYSGLFRFLGWSGSQLNKGLGKAGTAGTAALSKAKRADDKIVGLADKLGGNIQYTPGFTSAFWKAYWAGIQEIFTLKYWLKWLFRLTIWTTVLLIFLAALGAGMSISLPDIKLPADTFFTHSGFVSPVFTPEVRRWTPFIMWWSAKHGVDPNAAATLMQIESCGDPNAVSVAGAQGLFQVMPFHFAEGENMTKSSTNAMRGLTYFRLRLKASEG